MNNRLIILVFALVLSFSSLASPRIDYETFMTMNPAKQKEVVQLLMKAYATFEEVQRRGGVSLEEQKQMKQSLNILNKFFMSSAYAQSDQEQTNDNDFKQRSKKLVDDLKDSKLKKLDSSIYGPKNKKQKEEDDKKNQPLILPSYKEFVKKEPVSNRAKPTIGPTSEKGCVYAGWFSSMDSSRSFCQHPAKQNSYLSTIKDIKLGDQGCKGLGNIVCNPYIFGYTKNGDTKEVICAAGNGKAYNSSLACWKKSNEQDQKENITENIIELAKEKPEEFKKVLDTVFDMCLCGDAQDINGAYAKRMQRNRTCYGLLSQAQNVSEGLLNSCKYNDQGKLIEGAVTNNNLEDFRYINSNLTNFFTDNHNKEYAKFLTDIDSKLKADEKVLKDLDEKYSQDWEDHSPFEGEKCGYEKRDKSEITWVIAVKAKGDEKAKKNTAIATVTITNDDVTNYTVEWICDDKTSAPQALSGTSPIEIVKEVEKSVKKCKAILKQAGTEEKSAEVAFDGSETELEYKIKIAFTEDIPTKKNAVAEAIITNKDGEIVENPAAEGLVVVWYKTEKLKKQIQDKIKAKKEKEKTNKKKKDDENDVVLPTSEIRREVASKPKNANEKITGHYATGAKGIKFIRIKAVDPKTAKGYSVTAVLRKDNQKKNSNALIVAPIRMPTPPPMGGGGIGILKGSF